MAVLLEVRGVEKSYGATHALRGVDLRLERGEVVSLLGENGAGKSTLVKILSGVVSPDRGEVLLDGVPTRFAVPRDALQAGIAYIPQELSAVGTLTVAENLVLGSWPARGGLTSRRAIMRRAREICARTGMPLPLERTASALRLSDLQELEIAKALAREARIILLDEPTAALSEAEAQHLFELVRELTRRGVGVVFVSHRLDEVSAISDRVVVLRNGVCAADVAGDDATREDLVAYMVGAAFESRVARRRPDVGETVLEIDSLTVDGRPPIRDVSLAARRGEVVGIYGIRGSGLSTIAEALGGTARRCSGRLTVAGRAQTFPRTPRAARRAGIAYIPPDRKRGGLFPNMSVAANLSTVALRDNSRLGVVLPAVERKAARKVLTELDVKVRSEKQNVMTLSGGNQQKVLVAGRISTTEHVLVASEPTRGVDVGARRSIHELIRDLAASGRSVLVLSSDVEEIVNVSDRVLVMRDGRLVGELAGTQLTEANTIAVAAGVAVAVDRDTAHSSEPSPADPHAQAR